MKSNPIKKEIIKNVVAIDGPAAVGKTTVGKMLADKLGYVCFDTGVMYRAVTYVMLKKGVDYHDEEKINQLATGLDIEILPPSLNDGRLNDILIEGHDCTWEIRSKEVNTLVSEISAYPNVRIALTEQQRKIGRKGNMVMLGRDIGTIVMPDAACKIYLQASPEIRARRRYEEEKALGTKLSYRQVLQSLLHRDGLDSTRKTAPLSIAEDAIVIDTSDMNAEAVVSAILKKIAERHCLEAC